MNERHKAQKAAKREGRVAPHVERTQKTLAAQQAPATPTRLEFPFMEVDPISAVFGGIPNITAVKDACPREFYAWHNKWAKLARTMFFMGYDLRSLTFKHPELKQAQLVYLRTWLGSFEPQHEVKEAVCGWLLSLMLTECPQVSP